MFDVQKIPGITAAIKAYANHDSTQTYLIAIDLPLLEFYQLVKQLKPSDNGYTFLFTDNGNLFDLSQWNNDVNKIRDDVNVFLPIETLPPSVITTALAYWKSDLATYGEAVSFSKNSEDWWAGFRQLNPDEGRIWIGTVIPESDLIGEIYDMRFIILSTIIVIIFAGVLLVFVITRNFVRKYKELPLTRMARRNTAQEILQIIKSGEGKNVEFKSTMRMTLKSGKAGKEIEQAWLKAIGAFLNTDGGILLNGVDDSGNIDGIEADEFANDDKCRLHFKNLIKQHIGLEFSDYINMEIHVVQGRKVVIVEVDQAAQPAFLNFKDDEEFYIRSGPSSVKLPVSKVISYLQQRVTK